MPRLLYALYDGISNAIDIAYMVNQAHFAAEKFLTPATVQDLVRKIGTLDLKPGASRG